MSRSTPDFSTINIAELKKLKTYEPPGTYRLQSESGNGCYGDAPGYPTYFTKSIYTQHGNSPRYRPGGPTMVIRYEGILYVVGWHDQTDTQRDALMRRLYLPLPIEHPRVQAWKLGAYQHHRNCYVNPEIPNGHHADKLVIFPVPAYKLQSFKHDPRFSDAWAQAQIIAVNLANDDIRREAERICIPENHSAVARVRKFYPGYQPELDLIDNPGSERPGDWWETEVVPPTASTCTGLHGFPHRAEGWCQWCGITTPQA